MALCHFAEKKLIPPGSNDPPINPRIGILHVDASNASIDALYRYFKSYSNGIESHFHIEKRGKLGQFRNTDWEADANYKANAFAISVETQGREFEWWTEDQLATIKRLMLWCRDVHAIPLRKVSGPYDRLGGWGYHTLFGAPSAWTPVAKSCPGPNRKKQFHNILVPWMNKVEEEEEDMGFTNKDRELLEEVAKDVSKIRRKEWGRFKRTKKWRKNKVNPALEQIDELSKDSKGS